VKRVPDAALTAGLALVGYALVGSEIRTRRGGLIGLLLVLGAVEVIVAMQVLGNEGWTWRAGAHGLLAGGAVVTGIALAQSLRWLLVAAIAISGAAVPNRFFPRADDEGEED
jgi:hypothetical protein